MTAPHVPIFEMNNLDPDIRIVHREQAEKLSSCVWFSRNLRTDLSSADRAGMAEPGFSDLGNRDERIEGKLSSRELEIKLPWGPWPCPILKRKLPLGPLNSGFIMVKDL